MKYQESTRPAGGNPALSSNHLVTYPAEQCEAGNRRKGRSRTRIGAAFPHKEGPGFNVELKSIPLDGRIVLLPRAPANAEGERGNEKRKVQA